MIYDLLQIAWLILSVVNLHIGNKKLKIDTYQNAAFWGCMIMSGIACVLGKLESLL